MRIRAATLQDLDGIREVHLRAFPKGERELVSKLAIDLLSETTSPDTLSIVAEDESGIVGHVGFSPVRFDADEHLLGYILAPLAVTPAQQRHRTGSELVETGMTQLKVACVDLVFVYGDPKYYRRFGFNSKTAAGFSAPYTLTYPHGWLAVSLDGREFSHITSQVTCVDSLSDSALW